MSPFFIYGNRGEGERVKSLVFSTPSKDLLKIRVFNGVTETFFIKKFPHLQKTSKIGIAERSGKRAQHKVLLFPSDLL